MAKIMTAKKPAKLVSEALLPRHISDEDAKALDFYRDSYRDFHREYKEISDIAEKIDTAMGREKPIYKLVFGSTKDCKINPDAIPLPTSSYKI